MKTLRKLFLNASLLLGAAGAMAQSQAQGNGDNVWSLRECVDYALAHSVTIKQQDLQTLNAQATLNQSKLQQIPSVNGSSSFGFNSGRSIDRFTNAFVQQTFNFNSWGLNANVPIFSGFQTRHTIKQNALTVEANRLDADQTRLDVSLNTAVAYLNVLNNTELVEVAQLQVQTTREQLERTDKLVKAGTLPINNLYDLQSQLANDELALVDATNNVKLSKVNLMQTMNLPVTDDFTIEKIAVPDPNQEPYGASPGEIYSIAVNNQPGIRAASTRVESAKYGVRAARGGLWPSLSGFGGLSTNYVSTAPATQLIVDGSKIVRYEPVTLYGGPNGENPQNFFAQRVENGGVERPFTYVRQLDFNLSTNYGISLQLPIFNGWQTRTQVSRSLIQERQAEYTTEQRKITLRQNIEQAYNNLTAASQRFKANSEAVNAQQQAFTATKIRFENGLLNSVDFSLAQTRLGQAKARLVNAKYDYLFRIKILDFYQNKPLTFE